MKNFVFKLILLLISINLSCSNSSNKESENNSEKDNNNPSQKEVKKETTSDKDKNSEGKPVMSFEKKSHDFGEIKEGNVVSHTFEFKNTGKSPLVISEATASCGCTVPQWPKKPIEPGKKGKIKVEFNSAGKKGTQNKTIKITANTKPDFNKLSIKADVKPYDNNEGPKKK